MKIQYASDLHLEFEENARYLHEHPLEVTGEVLVLAGDIGYLGNRTFERHPFWSWAADNYEQVIAVPGNHELYGGYDIEELHDGWSHKIRSNVRYYYNAVISLGDTDLIATTLWGQIDFLKAARIMLCVNDFKHIRSRRDLMCWQRFNEEHFRCFHFLNDSVKQSTAKHIVVISHHVPARTLMAPEFLNSDLNGAFMVDLTDYIQAGPIDYWIYGHSHRNIDGMIGKTTCLSNQLGYVASEEHALFDAAKYIEI